MLWFIHSTVIMCTEYGKPTRGNNNNNNNKFDPFHFSMSQKFMFPLEIAQVICKIRAFHGDRGKKHTSLHWSKSKKYKPQSTESKWLKRKKEKKISKMYPYLLAHRSGDLHSIYWNKCVGIWEIRWLVSLFPSLHDCLNDPIDKNKEEKHIITMLSKLFVKF